jgi:hypothetical protein
MNLPHDLKSYRAEPEDSFVLLSGDACVIILCALTFGAIIYCAVVP